MRKIIDVTYKVYASAYNVRKQLLGLLSGNSVLAFDVECRSLYNKEERSEAKEYLKDADVSDPYYKQARVVSESSGLSFPSILKTTHFIFAADKNTSHIFICDDDNLEQWIWEQVAEYEGKFLVWNALFDLKICYQRTGGLPKNYVDGMLQAKCLVNSVDIWKAKVGLKDLVGEHYPAAWSVYANYEPESLKDEAFLKYCSYDGSATILAHELVQEEYGKLKESNKQHKEEEYEK